MKDGLWTNQAICALVGPELFHDDDRQLQAVAICQECPVQTQCVEQHMNEPWGVWGCSAKARRDIRRARRNGTSDPVKFLEIARTSNQRFINLAKDPVELPADIRRHLARLRHRSEYLQVMAEVG